MTALLRAAAAAACALSVIALAPRTARAEGPIVPDSSCSTESTFKSTAGDNQALLQIYNKSTLTVDVYWLNYDGKRVLYNEMPPFSSYNQGTFLTHPWVITDTTGQCLRFLVMTSQLQAVTVEPAIPDPDATTHPIVANTAAPGSSAGSPPSGGPAQSGGASPAAGSSQAPAVNAGNASDNSGLVAAVAVAAVAVVAGAGLAANGRLPGMKRRPPGP